jgi:hypothetical protein
MPRTITGGYEDYRNAGEILARVSKNMGYGQLGLTSPSNLPGLMLVGLFRSSRGSYKLLENLSSQDYADLNGGTPTPVAVAEHISRKWKAELHRRVGDALEEDVCPKK